ncbi:ATPase [Streptomyces yokosukanensis]|uniref:ATPase n=1 Tax=Streptomyces yokosukanensis TaxID=67386 RepID=A0A124HG40_9ACTN|nr:ATP-binding protein [Streptomyces yokosukanensis]KUN05832.1 ATPase [Streptomyces yokosukanensis]
MARKQRGDDTSATEAGYERAFAFAGELRSVTQARLAAEEFLDTLATRSPPATPEHWDDILLVVTELAANVIQYAPGPFGLRMRRTFDGVHVTMCDTSTTEPRPRPFVPRTGGGGIGWHLVRTLCTQVSVVVHQEGKDIHAFLPW